MNLKLGLNLHTFLIVTLLVVASKAAENYYSYSNVAGFAVYDQLPQQCKNYFGDDICDDSQADCGQNYKSYSDASCDECQTLKDGKPGFNCGGVSSPAPQTAAAPVVQQQVQASTTSQSGGCTETDGRMNGIDNFYLQGFVKYDTASSGEYDTCTGGSHPQYGYKGFFASVLENSCDAQPKVYSCPPSYSYGCMNGACVGRLQNVTNISNALYIQSKNILTFEIGNNGSLEPINLANYDIYIIINGLEDKYSLPPESQIPLAYKKQINTYVIPKNLIIDKKVCDGGSIYKGLVDKGSPFPAMDFYAIHKVNLKCEGVTQPVCGDSKCEFNAGECASCPGDCPLAQCQPLPSTLQGDFDGNGCVNNNDFFAFADAFNSNNPTYDLSKNGKVDLDDFFIFTDNFGKGCPSIQDMQKILQQKTSGTGVSGGASSQPAAQQTSYQSPYAGAAQQQAASTTTASTSTCAGKCGGQGTGTVNGKTCYCDSSCSNYGDCCADKAQVCG